MKKPRRVKSVVKQFLVHVPCLPWVLRVRDCFCFHWFSQSHLWESSSYVLKVSSCVFFLREGDISFFFFWRTRALCWNEQGTETRSRDPVTQVPLTGSDMQMGVCAAFPEVSSPSFESAVFLQTCHLPLSLPACSLNTLVVSFILGWPDVPIYTRQKTVVLSPFRQYVWST